MNAVSTNYIKQWRVRIFLVIWTKIQQWKKQQYDHGNDNNNCSNHKDTNRVMAIITMVVATTVTTTITAKVMSVTTMTAVTQQTWHIPSKAAEIAWGYSGGAEKEWVVAEWWWIGWNNIDWLTKLQQRWQDDGMAVMEWRKQWNGESSGSDGHGGCTGVRFGSGGKLWAESNWKYCLSVVHSTVEIQRTDSTHTSATSGGL